MVRYTLSNDFQLLDQSAGLISNESNVKIALSKDSVGSEYVILHPRDKIPFSKRLYAARAPSECGVAVIGILEAEENHANPGTPEPADSLGSGDLQILFANSNAYDDDWRWLFCYFCDACEPVFYIGEECPIFFGRG